jgi:hypothetical protein
MPKVCKICGKTFTPGSNRQNYCSPECKLKGKRQRYRSKRGSGKCTTCGKPAEGSLCSKCASKNKQTTKGRRERYINEGRCRDCGKTVKPGRIRCEECINKTNKSIGELRRERTKRGLCKICGRPATKGQFCMTCHSHYRNLERKNRLHRRIDGLCIICGQPARINPNGTISPYCPKHRSVIYRAQLEKRQGRKEKGLCISCGKPAYQEGEKPRLRCQECLDRAQYYKLRRRLGLPPLRLKRIR